MGLEVRTELLLDSAAACGTCRREGVGTVRLFVDESSLCWSMYILRKPRRPGDEVTARPLRQLRQWNGLVLDGSEHAVTGETVDGRAAESCRELESCRAHNLWFWARRRRSPGSTWEPREGDSWDEVSIWARCSAQCAK